MTPHGREIRRLLEDQADFSATAELFWHKILSPLLDRVAALERELGLQDAVSDEQAVRQNTMRMLQLAKGNKHRAAKMLGVDTKTVFERLRRWRIEERKKVGA